MLSDMLEFMLFPTVDKVIETYYRRHAKDSRVTLKQVCDELGASYGYTRKRKMVYDKRNPRRKKK